MDATIVDGHYVDRLTRPEGQRAVHYKLSTDDGDALWEFAGDATGISVRTIAQDQSAHQAEVRAPPDTARRPVSLGFVNRAIPSDAGPVLDLRWIAAASDAMQSSLPEVLGFHREVWEGPDRMRFVAAGATAPEVVTRFRNEWLLLSGSVLELRDFPQHARWSRNLGALGWQGSQVLTQLRNGDAVIWLTAAGAASDNVRAELWRIDREGNLMCHVELQQLIKTDGVVLHDTQDRAYVLGGGVDSSIVAMRLDDAGCNHLTLLWFERQQYALLNVLGATVDALGTLYIATHAGDRGNVEPMMCRWTEQDRTECFKLRVDGAGLPAIPEDTPAGSIKVELQAVGVNVVYMAHMDRLIRYEFPAAAPANER